MRVVVGGGVKINGMFADPVAVGRQACTGFARRACVPMWARVGSQIRRVHFGSLYLGWVLALSSKTP
jgi:hypothetical protein